MVIASKCVIVRRAKPSNKIIFQWLFLFKAGNCAGKYYELSLSYAIFGPDWRTRVGTGNRSPKNQSSVKFPFFWHYFAMLRQQYVYTDQAEILYGRAHIAGLLSHAKFGFDQIIWVEEPPKFKI